MLARIRRISKTTMAHVSNCCVRSRKTLNIGINCLTMHRLFLSAIFRKILREYHDRGILKMSVLLLFTKQR